MLPFLVLPAATFPWPCSDGTKQVVSDVLAGGRPLGVGTTGMTGTGVQCAELWSSNPDFLWQAWKWWETMSRGSWGLDGFLLVTSFKEKPYEDCCHMRNLDFWYLLIRWILGLMLCSIVDYSSVFAVFTLRASSKWLGQTPRVWRTCPCENSGHLNCPHTSSRIWAGTGTVLKKRSASELTVSSFN